MRTLNVKLFEVNIETQTLQSTTFPSDDFLKQVRTSLISGEKVTIFSYPNRNNNWDLG